MTRAAPTIFIMLGSAHFAHPPSDCRHPAADHCRGDPRHEESARRRGNRRRFSPIRPCQRSPPDPLRAGGQPPTRARPPDPRPDRNGMAALDRGSRSRDPRAARSGRRRHHRQLDAVRHVVYIAAARGARRSRIGHGGRSGAGVAPDHRADLGPRRRSADGAGRPWQRRAPAVRPIPSSAKRTSLRHGCRQGRRANVSARGDHPRRQRTGPDRSGAWRDEQQRPDGRIRPAVAAVPHARSVARRVADSQLRTRTGAGGDEGARAARTRCRETRGDRRSRTRLRGQGRRFRLLSSTDAAAVCRSRFAHAARPCAGGGSGDRAPRHQSANRRSRDTGASSPRAFIAASAC